MTLDEAIQRENKIAEENQKIVDTQIVFEDVSISELYCDDTEVIEEHLSNYRKCAEYHEQLAEWLEELKERRKCELCAELSHCFEGKRRIVKCDKFSPNSEKNSFFDFDEVLRIECEKARSKAIDDIVIKIKDRVGMDWEWDFMFIEQIAEQLKKEVGE